METALQRMGAMLEATWAAVTEAFVVEGAVDPTEPSSWPLGLWLLLGAFVVLLLLVSLRRRSRPSLEVRPPEILITQGELVPDDRTGRLGAGTLSMIVSNLGRYPVQLLETASRSGSGRFGVAESTVLVPAMGEAEVSLQLPVGKLEDGVLDLYCYAAATRTKTWRHRAELVWEPWAKRFKVAPLDQRIEPARGLASERRDVVRMDEVRKVAASAAAAAAAAPASRSTLAGVRERLRARRDDAPPRTGLQPDRNGRGAARTPNDAVAPRPVAPRAATGGASPADADAASARPRLTAVLGATRVAPVVAPADQRSDGGGASARSARGTGAAVTPANAARDAAPRAATPLPAAPPAPPAPSASVDESPRPTRAREQRLEFPDDF